MTYEDFRKEYEQQHPASIPLPPNAVASDYPRWLRAAVLVMFMCAALLSGVHTVPTVYAGIEASTVAPLVRDLVALASFVAVELAIFVAAYARLRGSRVIVTAMLVVTFLIALVSNVNSVLKALAASGDAWTTLVGIVLGFGAPLITFMAGELFVHMHAAGTQADAAAWSSYREERKQFDAVVLREWRKLAGQAGRPDAGQLSARTADKPDKAELHSQREALAPAPDTERSTGYGYERTSDAQDKAIEWFKAHPDEVNKPLRDLADVIGVGKTTVGDARKEWQRQQQVAVSVSSNGHSETST